MHATFTYTRMWVETCTLIGTAEEIEALASRLSASRVVVLTRLT